MVLQKRLDYGFNGFQITSVPRSARSARGRRLFKRKAEDSKMCAFELLATVAGDLLQEKETSHSHGNSLAGAKDTVKQEQQDQEKPLKVEPCDPGSCDESVFVSNVVLQGHNQSSILKESVHASNNKGSTVANSHLLAKADRAERTSKYGNQYVKLSSKVKGSASYRLSCNDKISHGIDGKLTSEEQQTSSLVNGIQQDTCNSGYLMDFNNKPPAVISSDSSAEASLCRNHIPCNYFPEARDSVKLPSKDDDENSSECTQPSTITTKALRPSPRIGDRRIRKLLASKYWRVAPKLKDGELSNSETRTVFRNRKSCYTRQRSQRFSPYGMRKIFERSSSSTSDGGVSSEGVLNSPEKGIGGDATASGSQASSSVAGPESSFHSSGSHVKVSIKSFRVPELFIEVSEMETVGSLKRTVMEAVTALLGGGLRVGIVLQGKKVRDDSKTLLQSGISDHDKMDSLGFILEPNPTPASAPAPLCNEDLSVPVTCEIQKPLSRCPTTPALDHGPSNSSSYPSVTNSSNLIESDRDSAPSPTNNISVDKTASDSRALVALPTRVEALSVVPLQRKSRRSELVQRRIRRPFSVSEVEALVQAVEKLGTGRWRDVKLCAFDNAKHRTYVDLKDKWKTLVHTARISPQQRRGEPVPQELLDRVLAAHAYWSQQQAKAQVKQQNDQYLLL